MTQIKVRISDGEVLEVKSHPSHVLIARDGEAIREIDGTAIAGMKLDGETVRNKRPEEIPVRKKTPKELRREELKGKPVLTIQELTEIVKGLI